MLRETGILMFDVRFLENAVRRSVEGLLMATVLGGTAWGGAGPSPFTTTPHGLLRNGRPFFRLGDTGWMLMRLSPADVERILTDYRKQPPKPVLNGEPGYENRAETPTSSAWKGRYERYWSVFSAPHCQPDRHEPLGLGNLRYGRRNDSL